VSRSPAERITDILDAIDRCQGYLTHLDDPDSGIAEMASDAILRNVANGHGLNRARPADAENNRRALRRRALLAVWWS
jgi:hypothetical protein